jgi:hypothetical protein
MKKFLLGAALLFGFTGCAHHLVSDDYHEQAEAAIQTQRPAFEACYKSHGGGQAIQVLVKYRTNYSGDLLSTEIDSEKTTGSNEELNKCVAAAFKEIHLPEYPRRVAGDYLLRFGH